MKFKPAVWFPIAILLSVGNIVAAWVAGRSLSAEPWHTMVHVALAVAAGVWAHRLRLARTRSQQQILPETAEALDALEAAEEESSRLRQELSEAQERLDFAERKLREPQSRSGPDS